MIVADTNVIVALVLDTKWSHLAQALLVRDSDWVAPVLWRSELRNILATQVRGGRIELRAAMGMAESAETVLAGREFAVDSAAVLRLAAESRCTAYDCEFVVLARHLGVRLVTRDQQVLATFPMDAVELGR